MIKTAITDISSWIPRGVPQKAMDLLSPPRREKVQRIRPVDGKCASAAAELLLRWAMKQDGIPVEKGWTWEIMEGGKPRIAEYPDFYFNLSHSGPYVACAWGTEAVGLDLQKYAWGKKGLGERFFCDQEIRRIEEAHNPDFCFTEIWAMKEAWLKWLGTGLRRSLKSFDANNDTGLCTDLEGLLPDQHQKICHWKEEAVLALCPGERWDGRIQQVTLEELISE